MGRAALLFVLCCAPALAAGATVIHFEQPRVTVPMSSEVDVAMTADSTPLSVSVTVDAPQVVLVMTPLVTITESGGSFRLRGLTFGGALLTVTIPATGEQFKLPVDVTWSGQLQLRVDGINPSTASAAGGSLVLVQGFVFDALCGVYFDGKPGRHLAFRNQDILVETPAHAAGPVDVEVRCEGNRRTTFKGFRFVDAIDPAPTVAQAQPSVAAPGERVTLHGSSFRLNDRVMVGDVPARILSTTTRTRVIEVPDAPIGKYSIVTISADGRFTTSAPLLDVLPYTPTIFAPVQPAVASGGELAISGRGFRPPYLFALGNRRLTLTNERSPSRVTVRIPHDLSGRHSLRAIDAAGNTIAVGPDVDVAAEGLVVEAITPACAALNQLVEITITGRGFSADRFTRLQFGGDIYRATYVWKDIDDQTIRVRVPWSNTIGTVDLQVDQGNAGRRTTIAGAFHYYSPHDAVSPCKSGRSFSVR